MTLHMLVLIQIVVVVENRRLDTRTGCCGSSTVLPPEGTEEQRWSRAFFLEQLGEGSVEKEPQVEGKNSPTSGPQELE